MTSLDAQSFDCMHFILQSIDLAFRFFVYGTHQGKPVLQPSCGGPDAAILDQTILSVLLKKLFSVFPLNPMHHLSDKVLPIINFVITIVVSD